MPFNGTGIFQRVYSWVADKDAGIDITASRTDTDTDDIATGLTSVITRDGQSVPTATLPMGGFRHTGVGNGVALTDYAALGQVQAGGYRFAVAGGTVNALTATVSPTFSLSGSVDGVVIFVRAAGANTSTTPTIAVNGGAALTITKGGLQALSIGDIPDANYECELMYVDGSPGKWELLNPWNPPASVTAGGTADALTATYAPAVTLFDGLELRVRAANANATTTPTFSPSGLTARTITKLGGSALAAGDIAAAGHELTLRYNLANTRWELLNPKGVQTSGATLTGTITMSGAAFNEAFATIASATTTNIGAAAANYLQVTGTTTITAFDTVQAGTERTLEFAGALILTYNATNLILANAASYTTQAGDVITFRSEGAGNWRQASPVTRIATKTSMQTATDLVAIVPPSQVGNHPGVAKVAVSVDSSGVIQGFNRGVSSTSKASTATYTVNFSTNFADTTYVCHVTTEGSVGSGFVVTTKNVGSVVVTGFNTTTAAALANGFSIACFGTQ